MVIISSEYRHLPTSEELPDSDETPVDNQLQNDIPNLLLALLAFVWADRDDWYFGVDMGIYYNPNEPAIVPDGFLALNVKRDTGERGRLSYVLWEEKVSPILSLEVISERYNGEYENKLEAYQALGILYYAIYNPFSGRRGKHKNRKRLEVYCLTAGNYKLLDSEDHQIWLPEISLGLGYEEGEHLGWQREWLYWYDDRGVRYPSVEERAKTAEVMVTQERQRAEQERQRAEQEQQARLQAEEIATQERQQKEKLAAYLRSLGINPDEIA